MTPFGRPSARRRAALSREGFEAVLTVLDGDRERAGEKYELLRRKLLRFFEWRGCALPDELADEAIDRVGRRLAAGERIHATDPGVYFLGVARFLLRETLGAPPPPAQLDELGEPAAAAETAAGEGERSRADCLERCLDALPPESRALVLAYYESEGGGKIAGRRALAERLGIGLNALRLRVHRLRGLLEGCLRECLAQGDRPRGGRAKTGSRGPA